MGWAGLGWAGLGWAGWAGLGWAGLGWAGLGWALEAGGWLGGWRAGRLRAVGWGLGSGFHSNQGSGHFWSGPRRGEGGGGWGGGGVGGGIEIVKGLGANKF